MLYMQIMLCDQPDRDVSQCSQTSSRLKKRAIYLVRFVVYSFLVEIIYIT